MTRQTRARRYLLRFYRHGSSFLISPLDGWMSKHNHDIPAHASPRFSARLFRRVP